MGRHVSTKALSAEQALWEALRARRLGGFRFRRQVPVGPHVADFMCHERAVVILVNAGAKPSREGRVSDEFLMTEGYSVFRVCACNILADMGGVCDALRAVLEGRLEEFAATTPHPPLPKNWGGVNSPTLTPPRSSGRGRGGVEATGHLP